MHEFLIPCLILSVFALAVVYVLHTVQLARLRSAVLRLGALPDSYVRVVRCRDCKHRGTDDCPMHIKGMPPDEWFLKSVANDYCSHGERKDTYAQTL